MKPRPDSIRSIPSLRLAALLPAVALAALLPGCGPAPAPEAPEPPEARTGQAEPAADTSGLLLPGETHLRNARMLTNGGENAEAYWSWDGKSLIFQAHRGEVGCDRIYTMRADGTEEREIASKGAHTCAYFLPGDERVVFSSTMSGGPDCPQPPDMSQGYVWGLFPDYEIYTANRDGSDVRRLTDVPGYDAEATVGPDGTIVFTSVRDGDLEIYTMNEDGNDVRRLTFTPGYDGGPFFSPDGTEIIYRARHPEDPKELADYQRLLAQNLIRPGQLEIWVMDADGSNQRRITDLGSANFAPFFTPDGEGAIFVSNHHNPRGRNFDLFLIRLDGTGLERITYNETFDGFPMFSPDGTKLAFCSNRGNARPGETNVLVAEWVP